MKLFTTGPIVLATLALLQCSSDGGNTPLGAPGGGGFTSTGGQIGGGGITAAGGMTTASGGVITGSGGTITGSGGTLATGGTLPSSGGVVSGSGGAAPVDGVYTAPGFQNLAPPLGAPLDEAGTTLNPPAPTGWTYHEIDGAKCRDGSPAGFYLRKGTADKLLWYLEGGGACDTPGFCVYNPANVNQVLAGNGQTVAGSIGGAVAGRQQPGTDGIFDITKAGNPFKDWSQIYTPYCTGDVYFGTRENATVPGLSAPQQFVGYRNMQKFVARIVPTFKDQVSRVIVTGASAGGFGAALNFSMIQDAFAGVCVDVFDDSGPPMEDQYMFTCMQKKWRELWGFADSLPPDCTECKQADGGGLLHLADFALRKHPHATLAAISGSQDEIIRLFFSAGLKECASFESADPVFITLGQFDPTVFMAGQSYTDGLNGVRARFASTGRLATYLIGGNSATLHQHIWRPEFYQPVAGNVTEAQWVADFLAGKITDVGP